MQQKNGPLQPPPMFFTYDHNTLPILDNYKGRSAFLIAGGPSLTHGQDPLFVQALKGISRAKDEAERDKISKEVQELVQLPRKYDLTKFYQPGIWSMTINNACRVVKSNAWACVDSPSNFIISNWIDPRVMKFAPVCHTQKTLFDNADTREMTDIRTMDCPNVIYYKRNEHFQAEQFLEEDTINWGCHKDYGGGRSIMFAAVRILYLLGFRRVFLCGVDMKMDEQNKYAFDQDRAKSSISGNNSTYRLMQTRFGLLKPIFDDHGYEVYNCNPESGLTVFPHMAFEDAVSLVHREEMRGIDFNNERTDGLYDREAKKKQEKEAKQDKKAVVEAKKNAGKYSDEDRREVKARLDKMRGDLDIAKSMAEKNRSLEARATDKAAWKVEQDRLDQIVIDVRQRFQTVEDEKRVKWGEPPKWGLWEDK